jgi:hypothetical protein
METQPLIVKLSRMISPKRLPFKKPARKSPKAIADARATRPITRLVRYYREGPRRTSIGRLGSRDGNSQ